MGSPFAPLYREVPAVVHGYASDAQMRYIAGLLEGRNWSAACQAKYVSRAAAIATAVNVAGSEGANALLAESGGAPVSKAGASELIDWLRSQPAKAAAKPAASDLPGADVVPAGRYAIDTADGAVNALAFYKVDRPTEGRWAGYVFVKHLVGGEEQRMSFAASKSILGKIAQAGAEAASARYGHEIGECGICARRLTNDESRERGIGPVCAANMGW